MSWQLQAYDRAGELQTYDTLPDVWWTSDASEVADLGLARLMCRAAPDYPRLAGWTVTAWREDGERAVARADDWLATLKQPA